MFLSHFFFTVIPFLAVPWFLDILLHFFFFPFAFQFEKFLLLISKLTGSFLSHMLLKGIPFPICCCMWSTFSIRSLNIIIIAILNSLSDNSKICVIYEASSEPCFLYSGSVFVLPFGMSCIFVESRT